LGASKRNHIETEYLTLIAEIEERQGELTPELEKELIINETQLQSKSIAYLEVVSGKEALNIRIDDEIKRLQALKKSNNTLISNLKGRLLQAVKLYGAFEVGLTKFGTRKSQQVIVEDVNTLPSEFKTIKVTESANKAEIKKAIKAGEHITGCELLDVENLKIN
jgi:hypothetical protein